MKMIEGGRDPGLHRQHIGLEGSRQINPKQRATSAPNNDRISTHSIGVEPSWLPHTLVNL